MRRRSTTTTTTSPKAGLLLLIKVVVVVNLEALATEVLPLTKVVVVDLAGLVLIKAAAAALVDLVLTRVAAVVADRVLTVVVATTAVLEVLEAPEAEADTVALDSKRLPLRRACIVKKQKNTAVSNGVGI